MPEKFLDALLTPYRAAKDWWYSSPLDAEVYPTVDASINPRSSTVFSSDPLENQGLKDRISRIKEPDVRTRVLYDMLAEFERAGDPIAKQRKADLRQLLQDNGAGWVRGNIRAGVQTATGGLLGFGDTLGMGRDRVSMPTETGESMMGGMVQTLPGTLIGSALPFVVGGRIAGWKPAAAEAKGLWNAGRAGLSKLAQTLLWSDKMKGNMPVGLLKHAAAWGTRDAANAWNQDWESERYAQGMRTAYGDRSDMQKALADPWQGNEVGRTMERGAHALFQGGLGALGSGLQPWMTRSLRYDQMKPVLQQMIIKGKAALASAAPQTVIGAPVQQYHMQRDIDGNSLARMMAMQLVTGGGMGAIFPADLPEHYRNRNIIASPGFNDIDSRIKPVVENPPNLVPAHDQMPQYPDNLGDLIRIKMASDAGNLDLEQQLAAAQLANRHAFVDIPEFGGPVRYTGQLDIPGSDLLTDRRIVMTPDGPRLAYQDDIVSKQRFVRPTAGPLQDQMVGVPPNYRILPGIEKAGKLWPVHWRKPTGPEDALNPQFELVKNAYAIATDPENRTLIYDPQSNRMVEAGTQQVRVAGHPDRSLRVQLDILLQQAKERAEKQASQKYNAPPGRTAGNMRELSNDLDKNSGLKKLLELTMKQREAAAPDVMVDPLGDIDPFATTPPIDRLPARHGRMRQSGDK